MLGREVVSRLIEKDRIVRVMSRSPRRGMADVEWAQAHMLTGEGLRDTVHGVDIVVHTAVDHNGAKTDVEMTRKLIESANAAGVSYFLYISIVAVDKLSAGPAKAKLACETLVLDGDIPSAALRFTQFFDSLDTLLQKATRLPLGVLPRG